MAISTKQIALVHVAAKQLGVEDDVYRAVLARWGDGAASAKDLDHAGFERVMTWFNAHGFRST
ncbi:MAG: regulatory protein GemA [Pseudomonadota bacterium]|nr:regulatory protein GemA [Pseudomonadota bacterium]